MPNILVIEDELAVLDNIVDTLEAERFKVKGTTRGEEGLAIASEMIPDLVICDVMMPGINGYEVLDSLRQQPKTNTIPFIFLTARASRDDMRFGMDLGADDYLTKPFSHEELLSAVRTRLKRQDVFDEKIDTALNTLRKNIVYALPHELRTPLTMILGFAEYMQEEASTLEPDDILEMSQIILKNGKRLHRMFENYLIYAQIELIAATDPEGETLRNHIIHNPETYIEHKATEIAQLYGRSADLSLDVAPYGLRISGENLNKIVEELVHNAFKFSKPGSRVQIKAGRHQDAYVICIRDYGCGITTDQIDGIGAYMQFDRAIKEQQGLGMGLAIVQRLVTLHQGSLEIKSKQDKGTMVCVYLPI